MAIKESAYTCSSYKKKIGDKGKSRIEIMTEFPMRKMDRKKCDVYLNRRGGGKLSAKVLLSVHETKKV